MSESAPDLPADLRRIVLIGFSATGKSVLAPYIAERLGWRAIDLDHEIEREAGRSIPQSSSRTAKPASVPANAPPPVMPHGSKAP